MNLMNLNSYLWPFYIPGSLRRFIGEFGTHYATTSKLGTRIVVERRFSVRERTSSVKVRIMRVRMISMMM